MVVTAKYVLIDYVINLGGTLTKLGNFTAEHGGVVVVNAAQNPALLPDKKFMRLIKERFGGEFTEIFGVEPETLTANEAEYLVGFRSLDTI